MKMYTRIALVCCLVSVVLHGYLTNHYYPLHFASAEAPSMCNLGTKFNCDAVTASTYSSVMGVPLSILGAVSNFMIFMMLLLAWIEWTSQPERLRRWAVGLAGVSALASVLMMGISLVKLNTYCPFCIGLYVLSFVIFETSRRTLKEPLFKGFLSDLPNMWAESQNILWAVVAIPVLSYIIHTGFLQNYGAGQMDRVINLSVADWASAPTVDLNVKPLLTKGPEKAAAAMTISEFADFRCHHCKNAANSLHAFTNAHDDVRFEYYAFPLDGNCSSAETVGISCQLAFAVYCAQAQGRGWEMHDVVYAAQDKTLQLEAAPQVKGMLADFSRDAKVDLPTLEKCMADPATQDAIASQSKLGSNNGINSTPSIFANGKLLPRGALIPVLEKAREKLVR
jgi:protein-disulfide isomerase/uncharacterized membrane protein